MKMRQERDSLGEKNIPADAWYGIHSSRSMENFDVAGERLPLELVYGMAVLKQACARAYMELDLLPEEKGQAIVSACDQVLDGEYDDQFVVDIFQAGSGTSSNMNVNEVLANAACAVLGEERGNRACVHPNDDVNKGQSTNNIFPSAIRVAVIRLSDGLLNEVGGLISALEDKSREFESVIKSGRTHLQDAVPVTLGQEFGAYARVLGKDIERIKEGCDKLLELGVGGNAVGTGINTKAAFREMIIKHLNQETGRKYRVALQGLEGTQFLTDLSHMSSALRSLSIDLLKISNDLRLLSSGPNTGFGEINLPAVEPGSSIMPGKINPSICEAANMACLQVMGYDHAIASACAAGQLELNTHMPLAGSNLVKAVSILTRCCTMLNHKCVQGIEANDEKCREHFFASAGLATVLNPLLGYDRVAQLVKESLKTGKTLKELVREQNIMSEEDLNGLLDRATGPTL